MREGQPTLATYPIAACASRSEKNRLFKKPPKFLDGCPRGGVIPRNNTTRTEVETWFQNVPFKCNLHRYTKGGIVFPLSIGIGVSVTWAGVPALMFLELEGGLFGCSLKAQITDPGLGTAAGLGALPTAKRHRFQPTDSVAVPFGSRREMQTSAVNLGAAEEGGEDSGDGGYEDPTAVKECSTGYERGDDVYEENDAGEDVFVRVGDCLPAMPSGAEGVECVGFKATDYKDPYGEDPAVIKVAVSVDVIIGSFAVSFVLRNFALGGAVHVDSP
jgi:hypothetical protein